VAYVIKAGYWRDPELTASRFSQDIDGRGTRIVRTGDWARINAKGYVEFCGRKDDRIKVRGNRIELAEIEFALKKLPGIADAAVVVVPREKHEPMLVAFVVLEADVSWSVSRLRHAVTANLPFQMVPSRFVFVDSLPLGPGGKIDREALRSYRMPMRDGELGEPPRTETETLLADIWAETLDLTEVGRYDDFFSLGGDSLKGAIVAAQIDAAFGIQVNLAEIADYPTVSALASFIDGRRQTRVSGLPPMTPVARRGGPVPLSSFQERLWKVSQARPDYVHIRRYCISGPLDVEILKQCLAYLVDRHEILRTTFEAIDGRPFQIVQPSSPIGFSFVDVSDSENPEELAESIFSAEAAKPIDPAHLPIERHLLIKLSGDEHWLLRTTHPLSRDGWSSTILMNELAALYEAKVRGMDAPIPKYMPLQYIDYAAWHNRFIKPGTAAYAQILAWWKQAFSKRVRSAKLPFMRSSAETGLHPSEGIIHWKLDEAAAERLDAFARDVGVTHFIVRLACFVALIADVTGRSTLVLGTYFANRHRVETRNIVGLFTNLAPMVFSYRRRLALGDWLRTVRDQVFETEARSEIPYEELYEQLRAAGLKPSGVRIVFTMSSDLGVQRFGGLTVTRRPYPLERMPWGCQVYIDERVPANSRVDFDAGYYPRTAMQAMVDRYLRLLDAASRQPDLTIGRLVAMSSDNSVRRAWANRSAVRSVASVEHA
jgi:acyl carrier protein